MPTSGIADLVVTNGVGALSAINGVAGANSEHVPVICVCGSLPLKAVDRRLLMRHTPAEGSQDTFYRAYEQATCAQARLTPQNAVTENRINVGASYLARAGGGGRGGEWAGEPAQREGVSAGSAAAWPGVLSPCRLGCGS